MSAKKYRAKTTGLTLGVLPVVLQCGLALMSSLSDGFLGDEGQQLIADVGYVPIRQAADESR